MTVCGGALLPLHVLQVDETTCQVTKDGRSSDVRSYMFVYRTSEHYKEQPVILYQYAMPRSKSNVQRFLSGFTGTLVSDAFSGYKALDKEEPEIRSAFCWAHARRDYADAPKTLKEKSAEERHARHQKEIKPFVEAYSAWVRAQEPASILSAKTRDDLKYSLNQEKYLKVFEKNGSIPIDNSATERAIRPFTVGRAN